MNASTTTTIECAERDGISFGNNGEWENTLSENIPITDGSSIELKQALIHTKSAANGVIVLTEPVTLVLKFGYYNRGINERMLSSGDTSADGAKPYSMFVNPGTTTNVSSTAPAFVDNIYVALEYPTVSNGSPSGATNVPTGTPTLYNQVFTMDLTVGSYAPTALAQLITNAMSNDPRFFEMVAETQSLNQMGNCFVSLNSLHSFMDGTKSPSDAPTSPASMYQTHPANHYIPMSGASETVLEVKNGRFEFSSFHTPLMSNAAGASPKVYSEESVSVYNTAGTVGYVQQMSGCFLMDMGPPSLVAMLGFDVTSPSFITNEKVLAAGNDAVASALFKIGTSLTGAALFNNINRSTKVIFPSQDNPATGDFLHYIQTSNNLGIRATADYATEPTGYYLLDVSANFTNDFYDSNQRKNIVAVLSKQYNNNDFITCYNESSVTYRHVGETVFLSSLRMRVLDPVTSEVVKSLGNQSVAFFEIVKTVQPPNKYLGNNQKSKKK